MKPPLRERHVGERNDRAIIVGESFGNNIEPVHTGVPHRDMARSSTRKEKYYRSERNVIDA